MSVQIKCNEKMFPIDQLVSHPLNDKIHTKSKIKKLAENILEFGFDQPLVANIDDKTITKGNGRYRAAILLKMTEVPVVFKKYESKEHQLAELKADNEIPLFEMSFDKEKTRKLIEFMPERLKEIALPDFSKIADIMRFDNPITSKPAFTATVMTSIEDNKPTMKNFDEDYTFSNSDKKEEIVSQAPKVQYKNLIIRLDIGIHDEVRKKLDAYFIENNIPALFL